MLLSIGDHAAPLTEAEVLEAEGGAAALAAWRDGDDEALKRPFDWEEREDAAIQVVEEAEAIVGGPN